MPSTMSNILSIEHLRVSFRKGGSESAAVHDVSLTVGSGEILGIVGESGSGKSLTCRAALRLMPRGGRLTATSVEVDGQDVLGMSKRAVRALRARTVGMIFQDPFTSLNPTLRIGHQLVETLVVNAELPKQAAVSRAVELLDQVEIPDPAARLRDYPHELSGGQRQRVMLALAIATNPRLLIADEPTTALDVSTQAQVLTLIRRLRDERGMSVVLVSHDFGVIGAMCDRVVVMYGGFVVESGTIAQVYLKPRHPYTRALLDAVPDLTIPAAGTRRPTIAGPPLGSVAYREGCPFEPRCRFARSECRHLEMKLPARADGHLTACPFVDATLAAASPTATATGGGR